MQEGSYSLFICANVYVYPAKKTRKLSIFLTSFRQYYLLRQFNFLVPWVYFLPMHNLTFILTTFQINHKDSIVVSEYILFETLKKARLTNENRLMVLIIIVFTYKIDMTIFHTLVTMIK